MSFFRSYPKPAHPVFAGTKSAEFNGTDEYVNIGSGPVESGLNAFSFSAWFRLTEALPTLETGAEEAVIFGTRHVSDPSWKGIDFGVYNDGANYIFALSMTSDDEGENYAVWLWTAPDLEDFAWRQAIVTYTGTPSTGEAILYLDGVAQIEADFLSAGTVTAIADPDQRFYIGKAWYDVDAFANGRIGDCTKWPLVLNQSQVTELYNSSVEMDITTHSLWPQFIASPRSLWITWEHDTFETSNAVYDRSYNAYKGTAVNMTNAVNSVADVPSIVFTSTKSVELNGVDEFINFGNICDEDASTDFTLTMWYKYTGAGGYQGSPSGFAKLNTETGNGYKLGRQATFGVYPHYYGSPNGNCYAHYDANGFKEADITDGNWHFLAVVYTASNKTGTPLVCYADGAVVSGGYSGNTLTSGASFSNTGSLVLGAQLTTLGFLRGRLNDMVKWPVALTTAQLDEQYNSGTAMNLRTHSLWSTLKSSSRSLWFHPEDIDVESANGVVDLTDNAFAGSGVNLTTAANIVEDAP